MVLECEGQNCRVIQAVGRYLPALENGEGKRLVALAEGRLPCDSCRRLARGLRGMRLGWRERMILLEAAPFESEKPPVVRELAGDDEEVELFVGGEEKIRRARVGDRAAQVATARAVTRLLKAGLLWKKFTRWEVYEKQAHWDRWTHSYGRWPRGRRVCTVQRTRLGDSLVARLDDVLRTRERIRWGDLPERLEREGESLPALLEAFAGYCKGFANYLTMWLMVSSEPERIRADIAACGRLAEAAMAAIGESSGDGPSLAGSPAACG